AGDAPWGSAALGRHVTKRVDEATDRVALPQGAGKAREDEDGPVDSSASLTEAGREPRRQVARLDGGRRGMCQKSVDDLALVVGHLRANSRRDDLPQELSRLDPLRLIWWHDVVRHQHVRYERSERASVHL